jgi:hypothetical protein
MGKQELLMKHHAKGSTALLLASMWVGIAACDVAAEADPKASVEAQGAANVVVENDVEAEAQVVGAGEANGGAEAVIEAKSFDLEAVTTIVQEGEIESAAELEVIINDEAHGYNHIDIDADGKIDHVQVVEVEVDGDAEVEADVDADVVLELRVIPSSKAEVEAAVTFATVTFVRHPVDSEVEIHASFTAVVRQPEVKVYTHVVPVKIEAGVLVGGSVFLSWVYATERPVYVGVYVVDERGYWIPPGHAKHGHWKATGHHDAHGEVHGHGKSKSKGDGRVVVDIRGGTGIHFGGSGKTSKHHSGSSSGGKSKSSKSGGSKSGGGKSGGGKSKGKGK